MFVTRTINYGWNEIRENYQATCRLCGKQFQRTTSTGYNDMTSPEKRAEYRTKLKADAEKYSKEPITCNACKKAAITQAQPVDLIGTNLLEEIADIEAEQSVLDERKKAVEQELGQHRNRLFTFEGKTYAQTSVSCCRWDAVTNLRGYRMSKVRPWEATDDQVQVRVTQITYLDDTLESRKAKVKEQTTKG